MRPRAGNFCFSEEEVQVIEHDVRRAKTQSANGVVIGVLRRDGSVDSDTCKRLRDLAWPMSATFHRAFDLTPDPFRAAEAIVEAGFDRILSSGQHGSAVEGKDVLARLVGDYADRIGIMVAGGVRRSNLSRVIASTGAREVHMRLDVEQNNERPSAPASRNPVSAGMGRERLTDAGLVREVVEKLARISRLEESGYPEAAGGGSGAPDSLERNVKRKAKAGADTYKRGHRR